MKITTILGTIIVTALIMFLAMGVCKRNSDIQKQINGVTTIKLWTITYFKDRVSNEKLSKKIAPQILNDKAFNKLILKFLRAKENAIISATANEIENYVLSSLEPLLQRSDNSCHAYCTILLAIKTGYDI